MNVRFLGALLLGVASVRRAGVGAWRRQHRSRPMHHEDRAGHDDLHRLSTTEIARAVFQRCSRCRATIIVLDAQQDELRDMALEIRILRNVGQKDDNENLEANTEIYVAPKKYKTGTLNFDYNFTKKGNFIGLVKARNDDGSKEYVSRFPFAVGETASKDLLTGLVLGAAGLIGFGLYYKHAFIDKKKPAA